MNYLRGRKGAGTDFPIYLSQHAFRAPVATDPDSEGASFMVRTAPLRLALIALVLGLAGSANAAVETWKLDTAHSSVGFTVRHNVISKVSGRFAAFDGTITFDPAKLE